MAPVGRPKQQFPEVLSMPPVSGNIGTPKIIVENQSCHEDRFVCRRQFFNVFTLPIIEEMLEPPLPNTAVITKAEAEKLSGATNAIGKIILLGREEQLIE
jgi:hypothetical protein